MSGQSERPSMASRNVARALRLCATLLAVLAPALLAQSPPYTQCPPVGASTSCGVLIVINADGSVTVLNDTSILPFDYDAVNNPQAEDTLVGVQNNSQQTITSLPLSGSGIFGFDIAGGTETGLCNPATSGCLTGYEGPGIQFVITDDSDGTVLFLNGIKPGGSAYFGLEGEPGSVGSLTVPLSTSCPASDATVGVAYSSQMAGTGGTPPYTWSVASGSLSPLTLDAAGLVSGTPSMAGPLNFTVQITDNASASAQQPCTINVDLGLAIDHIDMVQAIQNDQNYAAPIVAGKTAVVRVYPKILDPNGMPLMGITGTLSGTSPGGATFGPLQPLPAQSGATTARPAPDPNNPDDSLNFQIPQQWIQAGTLNFTATISPPAAMANPNSSNPTASAQVNVLNAPGQGTLTVGILPLCYQPAGADRICPTRAIYSADALLNKLLPIGDDQVIYLPIAAPGITWHGILNRAAKPRFVRTMRKIYDFIDAGSPGLIDQLFAWLPTLYRYQCGDPQRPANTFLPIGSSDPKWFSRDAQGHVAFGQDTTGFRFRNAVAGGCMTRSDPGLPGFVLAHEIAHNLGLEHANRPNQNLGCGASGNAAWPYQDGSIQQWGFDPLAPLFKPKAKMDLMTYCVGPTDNVWISPFDYKKLYDGGFQPQGTPPGSARRAVAHPAVNSAQVLIISGTVSRDGSTGSLDPAYVVNSSAVPPASDPNGNYCLNFSGSAGALGSYCFAVDFNFDDPHTPDEQATVFDEIDFSVRAALPAGTTRVGLALGGTELASLTATGNTPGLNIVSPANGDTWQGTNTIHWSGSSPTGGALSYAVLYSADGGQTWIPVSVDQTDSQFSLDTTQIAGGSNVFFRVLATAGLDTASADVGPITIQQSPGISAPASVDFGGQAPPQFVDQAIEILSTGSGPLVLSSISSDNPAFMALNAAPSHPLPPGSSWILKVRYAPSGTGVQSGTLLIASNDASQPQLAIALNGQAFASAVPNMRADAALDFGSTTVGSPLDLTFNISNVGSAPLNVNSVSSSSAQFTVTAPALPFTVSTLSDQAVTVRFQPGAAGAAAATLTVNSNDPVHPAVNVALTGTGVPQVVAPQINTAGVVNAASFTQKLAPGGLATIFGTNLAGSKASAAALPLPLQLGGASVTVGGIPAPLIYVSDVQINFQVPFEAPLGPTAIVVSNSGVASAAANANVVPYGVGVFTYARTATAIDPVILHANNQLVTPNNPATPNEVLIVYATGIGKLKNPPATGAAAVSSPLSSAVDVPVVTVGGLAAQVQFAGLTPGFAGLVQLNIQLPANLPSGSLPLQIQEPGDSSPVVNLAVRGNTATAPAAGAYRRADGAGRSGFRRPFSAR